MRRLSVRLQRSPGRIAGSTRPVHAGQGGGLAAAEPGWIGREEMPAEARDEPVHPAAAEPAGSAGTRRGHTRARAAAGRAATEPGRIGREGLAVNGAGDLRVKPGCDVVGEW
jgi:hypothetical protein